MSLLDSHSKVKVAGYRGKGHDFECNLKCKSNDNSTALAQKAKTTLLSSGIKY